MIKIKKSGNSIICTMDGCEMEIEQEADTDHSRLLIACHYRDHHKEGCGCGEYHKYDRADCLEEFRDLSPIHRELSKHREHCPPNGSPAYAIEKRWYFIDGKLFKIHRDKQKPESFFPQVEEIREELIYKTLLILKNEAIIPTFRCRDDKRVKGIVDLLQENLSSEEFMEYSKLENLIKYHGTET